MLLSTVFCLLVQVPSQENDGEILINLLGESTAITDILGVLGRIQGPWAFVYFQVNHLIHS